MSDHAPAGDHFSDTEFQQQQCEDFSAGKAVVVLMVGIFSTGVIIYSIVAYAVMF